MNTKNTNKTPRSTKKSMHQLISILNRRDVRVGANEPYTHGSQPGADELFKGGKYYISYEIKDNFDTALCNAVIKGHKMSITERPDAKYSPLRADFDFKSLLPIDEDGYLRHPFSGIPRRVYTEEILKKIVGIYQHEIKEILDIETDSDEILVCIVLEKEFPRIEEDKKHGKVVKDGFHLHFPKFICANSTQDEYIRQRVIFRLTECNIFKGCNFIEDLNTIVDQKISTKTWMMYGSMNYKNENSTPYLYNRIQQRTLEDGDYEDERKDGWEKIDPSRQYGHVYDHNLDEIDMHDIFEMEMEGRSKTNVRYYLPIFMSIRGNTECTPLNDNIKKKLAMLYNPTKKKKIIATKHRKDEDIYADLQIIRNAGLMQMLSEDRAVNHDPRMYIGWVLYNISGGSEEGLQMWIEFCQRASKEEKCEERWGNMRPGGISLVTLKMLAEKDNPIAYREWKQDNIKTCLFESLESRKPTEFAISKIIEKEYSGKIVCSNIKGNGEFYDFRSHRWIYNDCPIALHKILMNEILQKYNEFSKDLSAINAGEGGTNPKTTEKMKKAIAVIESLQTINFHRKSIEFSKIRLLDEAFTNKIDSNNLIIGCENGVLDLKMKVFRDGMPDDYCSLSTGVDFVEYDPCEQLDIDDFLEKVFPDDSIRKYLLAILAAALKGGQKRVLFLTGEPDGGKTLTVKIINKAFGKQYMGKFNRDVFLAGNRNNSGGARTDLMHMKNKKIMSTQEFAKGQRIDISLFKELTSGGDTIAARKNYDKDMSEIEAEATLIIPVNELPKLGNDEAVWERTRVIPCESKFIKAENLYKFPVPDTKKEQMKKKWFHVDESLSSKESIAHLGSQLLFRLFEIYKRNEKIIEPKRVMEATLANREKNDAYLEFKKERIEKIPLDEEPEKNCIRFSDLSAQFKTWYDITYPAYRREPPKSDTIQSEFIKILGIKNTNTADIYGIGEQRKFYGYRWIKIDDDDDDVGNKCADNQFLK